MFDLLLLHKEILAGISKYVSLINTLSLTFLSIPFSLSLSLSLTLFGSDSISLFYLFLLLCVVSFSPLSLSLPSRILSPYISPPLLSLYLPFSLFPPSSLFLSSLCLSPFPHISLLSSLSIPSLSFLFLSSPSPPLTISPSLYFYFSLFLLSQIFVIVLFFICNIRDFFINIQSDTKSFI